MEAKGFFGARVTRHAIAFAAFLALVVGLLTAPREALADGNADEADLHFEIAAELYSKGEFRGALEHFLASNRLVPNRNVVFNIARTYEKLAEREVEADRATKRYADAHRHYVDALEGETDEKIKTAIRAALARLAPNLSVLTVESNPKGATIYIDRRDLGARGLSPRPLALPPGTYKVIVEREGFEPAEITGVVAKKGEEAKVTVTLKEILGTVHVDVQGAPGADVHVGDEREAKACSAPCDFTLRPGTYLLYFSREGFEAAPRQVVVNAGSTARATARLSPLSGSIVVEADEPGAVVEIDGEPSGFTPAVIQNVAVGKHKVRVTSRGFAPVERDIVVKTNQRVELLGLRLEPLRQVQAVSRLTESVEDAPSSLTIIDGRELRAFGYPTIAEALRGVRGVYLNNDRAYWSAGIRGIGEPLDYGNRLLILSDGAVLNDDILNSSYIGSDGRTDLYDVDRIEVVRGPGSLLYGTGAFSGLVNLVPRTRDHDSSAHVGVGTYENRVARGHLGFNARFTEEAGMWASVAASRSDGFDATVRPVDPGTGPREVSVAEADRFEAVTTSGSVWVSDLSAQWLYHLRKQRIPVGAAGTVLGDSRTFYLDERAMGEVRYEPKLHEMVQLFTRAHANHYHFKGDYVLPAPDASLTEDYYGSWFGGEARVVVTPIKELRLVGGGEGQFHPFVALRGTEVEDDLDTPLADGEYLNEETSFNLGAAYVLVDASPIEWFRVSGGIRFDIYSTIGAIAVPRGALIFKPTDGGVLKLMSGRAFRAPSIYEQVYNDGGFSQVKATDLGAESIVSNEIEYSQRFEEDWVALGTVHTSFVEGIINSVPDSAANPDVIRYANSDDPVITVGGEVELRREWRQGWMLSGFYGYQRAQYLNPQDPALADNSRVINAPEHLAGLKGVVPLSSEIAVLGARATFEAPRRISLTGDGVTKATVIADATVSGFASRYGLRYVVGVYNLFDSKHEVPAADSYASATTLQNGRTFLVDLSLEYP